jgi:hypothetical protein
MDKNLIGKPYCNSTGKRKLPVLRVSGLMIAPLVFACANVMAQTVPEPKPAEESPTTVEDATELEENKFETEQGQSHLDDSFSPKTRRELIQEQRKKAIKDTKADIQFRSMYFDRDKFDSSESTAWGLGGYVGFKTGYFRDRIAFGATGYTSQSLYAPEGKGGTGVLTSDQHGYAVVGEAYAQFLVTEGINFDVGRKIINSPYINKNDTRMTPNTFQTAILQGVIGNANEFGEWRFGAGYVDKIKEKTSERFIPMSEVAGAQDGIDRGVYVLGANYKRGGLSIGAVDYYSDDIINIFYTEAKYTWPLKDKVDLLLAMQYSDQGSTGDELLTGSDFSANQFGVKAELAIHRAVFSTSWTTNGDDTDLRSPWGGIPSYNSVQVQDFNRAGEDAFMLRASYKFKAVEGLSAYALWVNGSQPTNPSQSAQDEYDFNLQWAASSGSLKGFSVRARYAIVTQDMGGPDLQDFRLIFTYDPPGL